MIKITGEVAAAAASSARQSGSIPYLDAATVMRLTPMSKLIRALRSAFAADVDAPVRSSYDLDHDGSLLLMPAWRPNGPIGVKVATVFPEARPAVQATYLLLDGATGRPSAILDGAMLTSRRTAAASALAADLLARSDASTLLLAGTGALAPHLIEAHASVRTLSRILIWGRDRKKADAAASAARDGGYPAASIVDLDSAVPGADIVTSATLSRRPIIRGDFISPGAHLDLVGAFRPDMAEADPPAFARAHVFVDTRKGALEEAGDLIQAIAAGTLEERDIEAELADLCIGRHPGRAGQEEMITLFKSVGTSLEDLAAAEIVWQAWQTEYTSDP